MRNTRGFNWHYLAFIFVVSGLVYGFYELSQTQKGFESKSAYHSEVSSTDEEAQTAVVEEPSKESDTPSSKKAAARKEAKKGSAKPDRTLAVQRDAEMPKTPTVQEARKAGGICESDEIPGDQPSNVKIGDQEWAQVTTMFYAAQGALKKWLENHKTQLGAKSHAKMLAHLEKVQVEKPPYLKEPDLAWRGIGIWTYEKDHAVIQMGEGFVKLAKKNPQRAQFEITRLVAQTFQPCELKEWGTEFSWQPLLTCLGVEEKYGCDEGSYSEAGWAVSTALAQIVSPPNCKIPAFENPSMASCLQVTQWQEARR